MVRIFLNTGLRRQELFKLTWDDVDFRRRQLYIRETKTSKSRYIPMNETVCTELRELNRNRKGEGLVFKSPKTGKGFVDIRRAFYGACRRAKIRNLLLLDLRRTFATRLLEAGADIITVQQLLGSYFSQNYPDIHHVESRTEETCSVAFRAKRGSSL
jgi:integrase